MKILPKVRPGESVRQDVEFTAYLTDEQIARIKDWQHETGFSTETLVACALDHYLDFCEDRRGK